MECEYLCEKMTNNVRLENNNLDTNLWQQNIVLHENGTCARFGI